MMFVDQLVSDKTPPQNESSVSQNISSLTIETLPVSTVTHVDYTARSNSLQAAEYIAWLLSVL